MATIDYGTLCDYQTGATIRRAQSDEWARSTRAARTDGGAGVIDDGTGRSVYVEGGPTLARLVLQFGRGTISAELTSLDGETRLADAPSWAGEDRNLAYDWARKMAERKGLTLVTGPVRQLDGVTELGLNVVHLGGLDFVELLDLGS